MGPKVSAAGASGGGGLPTPDNAFIREDGVITAPPGSGGGGGAFPTGLVTLTDAPTIAVDAAAGSVFLATLNGDRTLGTPSNPVAGQPILFEFIQGAGGGFTLAFSAGYAFPASIPQPTLSTTAGQRDFLQFTYDALVSLWQCTGWVPDQNAGIVTIPQGGTGQDTQQAALNALAGAQTSGEYLRGTGTNVEMAAIEAADLPAGTTSAQGALQLDGTAGDIQPVGTAAVAGAKGQAADAEHVHASIVALPSDFGFAAWTMDPNEASVSTTAGTSLMLLTKFFVRQQVTLTNVFLHVVAGAVGTLTSSENFVCVYDSTGTQRAISPDQSTAWATLGLKEATFTGAYVAPAGWYYLVINMVVSGGNGPTFRAGVGSGGGLLSNAGLSGSGLRNATQAAVAGTPGALTYSGNSISSAAAIAAVFT